MPTGQSVTPRVRTVGSMVSPKLGKTTILNCVAAAVPARERVVICEEVFELPRWAPGRAMALGPSGLGYRGDWGPEQQLPSKRWGTSCVRSATVARWSHGSSGWKLSHVRSGHGQSA